jgi:hypothetical protein
MILSNTVASSVVLNGATCTANTPADESAPRGFMPASNGQSWVGIPGPAMALVTLANGTSSGTTTMDWSQGGYFTWTPYGGACSLVVSNAIVGQMVLIKVLHVSSANITWPVTTTWYTGSSGTKPDDTGKDAVVAIVCTGAATYDAWLVAQQS